MVADSDPVVFVLFTLQRSAAQIPDQAANLYLVRGSFVYVRVDDPEQAINRAKKHPDDEPVVSMIRNRRGEMRPLRLIGADGTAHHYRLLVPRDSDLRLTVYPKEIQLEDSHGIAVDPADTLKPFSDLKGENSASKVVRSKGPDVPTQIVVRARKGKA